MVNYKYITDSIDDDLITNLASQRLLALDIETTCLDQFSGDIRLIQIGTENKEVYIFDCFSLDKQILKLSKLFHKNMIFLGHNLKFECLWLWSLYRKYGECLDLSNCKIVFDTYIASQVINNGKSDVKHGLKDLCATYLSVEMSKEEQVSDWSQEILTNGQLEYAANDVYYLHDLRKALLKDIYNDRLPIKLDGICKLEFEFMPVLASFEYNGVDLDIDYMYLLEKELEKEIKNTRLEIYPKFKNVYKQDNLDGTINTYNINLQSNSQVLNKLLELGVPVTNVRKETMALQDDLVCQLFSKVNSLSKNQTTYCSNLIPTINKNSGRSHPNIFQLANITGRMKTGKTKDNDNKPKNSLPLLTIPRDARYRKIVKCAKDNYYYLDTDYSQIESRLVAWASQCVPMLEAFNSGKCVYSVTVSKLNNIEYDDFNIWRKDSSHPKHKYAKGLRQNGKGLILGMQFGMGIDRYKEYVRDLFQLFKSRDEAEKDRGDFFKLYPEIKIWHKNCWDNAQNNFKKGNKFIQNINGRILYWDNIESKYNVSINYGIQSLATDIIKIATTRIFNLLKQDYGLPLFDRSPIFIVGVIHDAITMEGRLDLLEKFQPIKQAIMENTAYEIVNKNPNLLPISFGSESNIGKDLAEAH